MTKIVSARGKRGTSTTLSALGWLTLATTGMLVFPAVASATPSLEANEAINARYTSFGGAGSLLGAPTGEAFDVAGGAERDYQGGAIFYSTKTGADVMYGAILDRYRALGGPAGELGFPTNDESDVGNGIGRFNNFAQPGGASIYWSPEWGASVVRGRVLDAWRSSGGVTGPFGYPTSDTAVIDGVQTGKFVGPGGTEIQWSQTGGLITVPAGLAATLPGFASAAPTPEGTQLMPTPPSTSVPAAPTAPVAEHRSASKWWWIPIGIAVAAALAGLLRLLTRRRPAEPAAPAEVLKLAEPAEREMVSVGAPKAPAPKTEPVAKSAAAKVVAPAPKAPAPKAPVAKVPVVKAPAKPTPVSEPVKAKAPVPPQKPAGAPKKVVTLANNGSSVANGHHSETVAGAQATVVKYETPTAAAQTTVQVTYENNAVGVNQESAADKSSRL